MRNVSRWLLPMVLLVGVMLTGGFGVCFAQNTSSGDIRGTATDPTGAVIQGVTVNVTDIDKGVARSYVTDGAGSTIRARFLRTIISLRSLKTVFGPWCAVP